MSPWERRRLARLWDRGHPARIRALGTRASRPHPARSAGSARPHPHRVRPRPRARAGHRLGSPLERRPPPRRRPGLEPGRLPRHHLLRDADHRRDRGRRHAVLERLLGQPRLFAHQGEPDDRQEPGAAADHGLHPRQPLPLRAAPPPSRSARTATRRGHDRRAHEGPGLRDRPLRQVAPQRGQGVPAGTANGPGAPRASTTSWPPSSPSTRTIRSPTPTTPARSPTGPWRSSTRTGTNRSSSTSPTTSSTVRCWRGRSWSLGTRPSPAPTTP